MSENFADLFEESLLTVEMNPGAIITGVIIDIDKDWVTVHAGLKSEGVISIDQFYDEKGVLEVAIGDEVQVALEASRATCTSSPMATSSTPFSS